jgi:hypothetical protein
VDEVFKTVMDFSSGAFLVVTKLGFDHRGRLDVGKKLDLRFKIFGAWGHAIHLKSLQRERCSSREGVMHR